MPSAYSPRWPCTVSPAVTLWCWWMQRRRGRDLDVIPHPRPRGALQPGLMANCIGHVHVLGVLFVLRFWRHSAFAPLSHPTRSPLCPSSPPHKATDALNGPLSDTSNVPGDDLLPDSPFPRFLTSQNPSYELVTCPPSSSSPPHPSPPPQWTPTPPPGPPAPADPTPPTPRTAPSSSLPRRHRTRSRSPRCPSRCCRGRERGGPTRSDLGLGGTRFLCLERRNWVVSLRGRGG